MDVARLFRHPLLPETDLLSAHYVEHTFSPHWHDCYVVPVIQAGAQLYQYAREQHLAVFGSIGVINPGEVHTGMRAGDDGWTYRAFYPPVSYLQKIASDLAGKPVEPPWFPLKVIHDIPLAQELLKAHLLLEQQFPDWLEVETRLYQAMSVLITRYSGIAPVDETSKPIRHVAWMKEVLSSRLEDSLTLEQLAAETGLSAFHAARMFSQQVGMPPHAWRNHLRLNRSLGMLKQGQSISATAAALGFTDQSHFNRHFKRAFGVAPSHWKAA
ncbi:AraC family transcriptional regulator [Leeia sp. TBRC 13508]|uniref:AraC family transcriptional regulator n=1 Tax=Leeia speluncae TaxID=2884804 RepID=A0ABS8D7H6_9NEIS|nr:AraC family transcriptional regulator [Leeia speluncae]MCB6184150.1 AraC family transcriptional regulator [Leeia speluncae]